MTNENCRYYLGIPEGKPGQQHLYRVSSEAPRPGTPQKLPYCVTCNSQVCTAYYIYQPSDLPSPSQNAFCLNIFVYVSASHLSISTVQFHRYRLCVNMLTFMLSRLQYIVCNTFTVDVRVRI